MTVQLPKQLIALHEAGRFDYWGAPYQSLSSEEKQQRSDASQLEVFWWDGVEWEMTLDEIRGYEFDGSMRPGLVPFAGTGYGDAFCFYPPWDEDGGQAVVRFVHDELESFLFARSYPEFLVRALLRHHCDDARFEQSEAEARALFQAHAAILRPHLPEHLVEVLEALNDAPTLQACEAADNRLSREVGERRMIGTIQPTRYVEKSILRKADLIRAYRNSEAFYRELVEDEARAEFGPQLATVRARLSELAG